MTLSDFFKLIRHYIKMVIIVPVVCAFVATAVVAAIPPTYIAKATLLTNGDIALAGGYAQNEECAWGGVFSALFLRAVFVF